MSGWICSPSAVVECPFGEVLVLSASESDGPPFLRCGVEYVPSRDAGETCDAIEDDPRDWKGGRRDEGVCERSDDERADMVLRCLVRCMRVLASV